MPASGTLNTPTPPDSSSTSYVPLKPSNKHETMMHVLLRENQRAMAENFTCLQQLSSKVENKLAETQMYENVLQTHHAKLIAEVASIGECSSILTHICFF